MKAILSDIHGNIDAFEAVLEDIRSRDIEEVVCLGDVIGYGPNPRECLDLAAKFSKPLILGNHEEAVVTGDSASFNSRARRAVDWTREQLMGEAAPEGAAETYRELLSKFQEDANIEGIRYAHGSPRRPTKEYITPRDARNRRKMAAIFDALDWVCFIGHTHFPGVFTESTPRDQLQGVGGEETPAPRTFVHESPEELPAGVYMLSKDEKALINVGSVGQPRDGNARACYATFDMDTVVFRRVEYDVEPVVAKIRATPSLDNTLAVRLRAGR